MTRLEKTFKALPHGSSALVAYVTGGDPAPAYTPKIVRALADGGVDMIELGIPFSDPIADGPTIQAGMMRSLGSGTTPSRVLDICEEVRDFSDLPLVVLTYYNPVFRAGIAPFLQKARDKGVDGFIVADLPVEEAGPYKQAAMEKGVDTIFLASPATSLRRLTSILQNSTGFLYLVSLFGVTGAREQLQLSTIDLVQKFLPHTMDKVPLCVGFGISKPEHVRAIRQTGAQGIIVGSAFVKVIEHNVGKPRKMLRELESLASRLKKAAVGS